mmetsp:Transcript_44041/g.80862  ORF Transcript_44041/g.80862 Transcript_44041/m.80862 type:complete len:220 (+) Transcript_44041:69-728(+)
MAAYAVSSTYAAMPSMTTMVTAAPYAAQAYGGQVAPTSYTVAAPTTAAVSRVPPPVAATPPQNLTEGLPDERQIAAQKAAYAQALDLQLQQATEILQKETAIEKEMLSFKAQKDIAMFNLSVEEKLVEQLASVDEQTTFQQLELLKAATDRKLQLANQASALTMDYSMKKAQEEMALKQYDFQQRYLQTERDLAQQYAQAGQQAVAAAATLPPPVPASK